MKDITKEEKEFLQSLSQRAALPDPKFKKLLKAKVEKEYYKNSSILPKLTLLLGSLAVLSFIFILFGGSILNNVNPDVQTLNTSFSKEEKQNVYQNILKNNPIKVVQASVSTDTASNSKTNLVTESEIAKVQQKYTQNYYLAEFSTLTQTFNNQCLAINISTGTTTFTEYRDKDKYFSKIVNKDFNNVVTSYNLTKIKGLNIEEYSYTGNGNVVKTESTLKPQPVEVQVPSSFPTSYIAQTSEEDSFFEGTVLDQKIKKNGKEYYVLKTESFIDCGETLSYPTSYGKVESKIITLSYFNADSFVLELTESYINQATSTNLLYSQTYLKREKQVDIQKIEREFEYDLTLEVEDANLPVSYTKNDL